MKKYISLIIIMTLASCGTLNLKKGKLTLSKNIDSTIEFREKDENTLVFAEIEPCVLEEDRLASLKASNADLAPSYPEIRQKSSGDNNIKDSSCDKILMKTGEEIEAKVLEIGVQEIKYKYCSNLQGPTISVLKSDAFMITYANGSKEVFKNNTPRTATNANSHTAENTQKKTNGFAVTSLILGILGVSFLGLIFGSIAMSQIRKYPETQSGYGMAVAGVVLSTIGILILITLLLI